MAPHRRPDSLEDLKEEKVAKLQQAAHRHSAEGSINDMLAAAKKRGQRISTDLLAAEGGTLTGREVSDILKLRLEDIETRRVAGSLLAMEAEPDVYLYPAWQFTGNRTLPGLEEILQTLRRHDPWLQLWFFLSSDYRLSGATPLAELRNGNIEGVRRAARMFGEHGAA